MKKLIYCALALAAGLFAASCQQENLEPVAQENTVTYTVELPGVETKAIADGSNVDRLYYEVWKINAENATDVTTDLTKKGVATRLYQKDIPMDHGNGAPAKTVVTLNLVQDQEYTILFWAQNSHALGENSPAYNTANLTAVTYVDAILNGNKTLANNESLAAFYAVDFVSEGDPKSKTIYLKRPFAQLNIGTLNTADREEYSIAMQTSKVTVSKVPTVFNVATSSVAPDEEATDFVFDTYWVPNNPEHPEYATNSILEANGVEYQYAAMNYIFANHADTEGQSPTTVEVDFNIDVKLSATDVATLTTTDATINHNVPNVPLSQNYRTNIVGNLLTSETEYNVIVDPNWADGNAADGGYVVEKWNGTEIKAPEQNANGEYEIEMASELAWLAGEVNGTNTKAAGNSFAGKTFVLTADIDLDNQEWSPIGNSTTTFQGIFDGQNHTIKNLFVNGGNTSNQGLFGMTTDGEIKNLVVENAKVSGRLNVGVIAGTPYTSKYTNITVKGHVEVNGMAYVGGVGGKNAYADWTNITVNVDETSYVNANSVENGTAYRTYVGGVVGFNGEGAHSFKNITSNINVEGSTCDVGGLFGIAHYGNNFENCSCTGNVKITAAEEAEEAEEVGGVAGVWHNQSDQTVTMTNVSFSGKITTNIERGTVWYGNLVGKPYGSGEGKLSLNGLEFNKDGVNFAIINEILANAEFVFPFDLIGIKNASNGYGGTGITHNGKTLNGNGFTLKVKNAGGTWDSALATKGGTIKNLTVAQGFRGIFVMNGTEPVVLDNVIVDGPTYTISCDKAGNQGIKAYNSTFNGWTSYAGTIGEAYFENCSFGEGAGYKFARPYAPTTFVNCDFCEGYKIDARAEVVFVNCTINDVELTDIEALVSSNVNNAKIYTEVSTSEELVAALAAGENVLFKNDINVTATKGGYNKAGILQNKAQAIDGNGHTLTVTGAGATWDCAIYTNGGLIKNLTVDGAMRGIFTAGQSSDLQIDNVEFKNVIYTFNSDGKMPANPFGVYVSNSKVNGWTSHSNMHTEVVYTNCSFGEGSGYKYCRPYGKTSFVNCTFCAGYTLDDSQTSEITETDCTWE